MPIRLTASPDNLRILRVRGNSMEPEMRDGDRIVVDISRRIPATGEVFVLSDRNGLVVKRVGALHGGGTPPLRILFANPDYAPDACLAKEIHLAGKAIWTVRKA